MADVRVDEALTEADYRDQADFRYALRRFERLAEMHARQQGITPQQYLLLLLLRGHPHYPNVAIGELADRLQLRHHSVSLLVARCVKRGLVRPGHDPADLRRVPLAVTAEGQAVLDQIMEANRRELETLAGALFRDSLREALVAYVTTAQLDPDGR